jgi:hypothetical protein
MGHGRGNWKCAICKSKPKNPVKITAGAKALRLGKTIVLQPGEGRVMCKSHVKDLHI